MTLQKHLGDARGKTKIAVNLKGRMGTKQIDINSTLLIISPTIVHQIQETIDEP